MSLRCSSLRGASLILLVIAAVCLNVVEASGKAGAAAGVRSAEHSALLEWDLTALEADLHRLEEAELTKEEKFKIYSTRFMSNCHDLIQNQMTKRQRKIQKIFTACKPLVVGVYHCALGLMLSDSESKAGEHEAYLIHYLNHPDGSRLACDRVPVQDVASSQLMFDESLSPSGLGGSWARLDKKQPTQPTGDTSHLITKTDMEKALLGIQDALDHSHRNDYFLDCPYDEGSWGVHPEFTTWQSLQSHLIDYAHENPSYSLTDVNCQKFASEMYNSLAGNAIKDEEKCYEYQYIALGTLRAVQPVASVIGSVGSVLGLGSISGSSE